jgi:hypothetical protein
MKLLIFAACEKVIIDQFHNPSLITLMQNVNYAPQPPNSTPPRNAVTPEKWVVFTSWLPTLDEIGKEFEQITSIELPDKSEFTRHRLPFRPDASGLSINYVNFLGFPIGQEGNMLVTMWLERENKQITEPLSYPIKVRRGPPQ